MVVATAQPPRVCCCLAVPGTRPTGPTTTAWARGVTAAAAVAPPPPPRRSVLRVGVFAASLGRRGEEGNSDEDPVGLELPQSDDGLGDPRVVAAVTRGSSSYPGDAQPLSMDEIIDLFPFPLDPFQREAADGFIEGASVVVCAPTGAGKTAIAEVAAIACLSRGQRVIYTTPLKALSNQKVAELRGRFGASRVGLQTGDTTFNAEAPITVMTTEILRNIMYRVAVARERGDDVDEDTALGTPGAAALPRAVRDRLAAAGPAVGAGGAGRLDDVGLIVLDEVHYLSDPWRGVVWEEVIINCPAHVQLLAMSATVRNPSDLGNWIAEVQGRECRTIRTTKRPVPLAWRFAQQEGRETVVYPLLSRSGKQLSRELRRPPDPARGDRPSARDLPGGWGAAIPRGTRGGRGWRQSAAAPGKSRQVVGRGAPQPPRPVHVVEELRRAGMLPAIWFVFSRRGCDENAARVARELPRRLLTDAERDAVTAEIAHLRAVQPEALREGAEAYLLAGVACHHAGCLPAWKTLVERLFQRGILKLVFATDTLAAGINMPAKTTVIDALARRKGAARHAPLAHNELLQMAGRAGRRGYDKEGACVIIKGRFEGCEEAFDILRQGPEPLVSQFVASYGMTLNVLATRGLAEAEAFMGRSFGGYMAGRGLEERAREIIQVEDDAVALVGRLRRKHPRWNGEGLELSGVDADILARLPLDDDGGTTGAARDETTSTDDSASALTAKLRDLSARLALERGTLRRLREQQTEARWDAALAVLGGGPGSLPRAVGVVLPGNTALSRALAINVVDSASLGLDLFHDIPGNSRGMSSWAALSADDDDGEDDADNERWRERVVCVLTDGRVVALAPGSIRAAAVGGDWLDDDHDGDAAALSPEILDNVTADIASRGTAAWTRWRMTPTTSPDPAKGSADANVEAVWDVSWDDDDDDDDEAEEEEPSTLSASFSSSASSDDDPDVDRSFLSPASDATRAAGAALPPLASLLALGEGDTLEASIIFQTGIVDMLVRQVSELAGARREGGDGNSSSGGGLLPMKAGKKLDRANRLLRRITTLRRRLKEDRGRTWRSFEDTVRVLREVGAIEPTADADGRIAALPLGEVARDVRTDNELWSAMILTSPGARELDARGLAGLVAAVVTPDSVGSRPGVGCAYAPSAAVLSVVAGLEEERARLEALQRTVPSMGEFAAVNIDTRLVGMVEAWAAGATWSQVAADTQLDGGDLARLLSRVVDVLRQASRCPHLDDSVRTSARTAVKEMVRMPISDLVAF